MAGTAALDTSNINLEEAEKQKGARAYSQRGSLQAQADIRFVKSKEEGKKQEGQGRGEGERGQEGQGRGEGASSRR